MAHWTSLLDGGALTVGGQAIPSGWIRGVRFEVSVSGHYDSRPSRSLPNAQLADRRARSVADRLRDQFTTTARPTGELRPGVRARVTGPTAEGGRELVGRPGLDLDVSCNRSSPSPAPRWSNADRRAEIRVRALFEPSRAWWRARALRAAKIDESRWQPERGFTDNQATFFAVYQYYQGLHNLRPAQFLWAAMAKLAGGEVYRGLKDELQPYIDAWENSRNNPWISPGAMASMAFMAGNAKDLQIRLLKMQKDIFVDLAWQHQAFLEGDLKAMEAAGSDGELDQGPMSAWRLIASGDKGAGSRGNFALLLREQRDILEPHYRSLRDLKDFDLIPDRMSRGARCPIAGPLPRMPRCKDFRIAVPDGDVTVFQDRWRWIELEMIPAFERLTPERLHRLVNRPIELLAKGDFGP